MTGYLRIGVFLLLLSASQHAFSQHVNGYWYGIGAVHANGENSSYMAELTLKQKGRSVTGVLSYYFRDSLFTAKFTGNYDTKTRRLNIDPLPFIYYRSASTKLGVDCFMSGNFQLLSSRKESLLTGSFVSDPAHRYTVPDLNFRFRFSTDTVSVTVEKGYDTTEAPAAAIADASASRHTDSATTITRKDFLARSKNYVKELEISSPVIRVEIYDNGVIDYDSVSVFLNNKEVLSKSKLTHRAIKLRLNLDSTLAYNELSMYAENLGLIPPNTAAMIIYDGKTRHELILTSDLNKTATIRLKRKEVH